MQQPEAKFKKKLNDAFAAVHPEGWSAYVKAIAKNGVPDLYYQIPNRHGVWAEAKVDGNQLSPAQQLTIGKMVRAGSAVKVVSLLNTALPKAAQRILVSRATCRGPSCVLLPLKEFGIGELKQEAFWNLVLL